MVQYTKAAAALLSLALSVTGVDGTGFMEHQWNKAAGFELGSGNVVEWMNGGEDILVTGKNCGILILDKYGAEKASKSGSDDYECMSGVAHMSGKVYQAVNYKNSDSSYLQCLDEATLTQQWNVSIPGTIEGTPVVGDYVYLVHNTNATTTASAHFSIVSLSGEHKFTETKENTIFAPLAIQLNPPAGPYAEGASNQNDLLAWGKKYTEEHWDNPAHSKTNANLFFQLPVGEVNFTALTESDQIRSGGLNGYTLSPPTLTGYKTNKYIALEQYKIRGLVTPSTQSELKYWGQTANLIVNPPQGSSGNRVPPPSGPVVINDGTSASYVLVTGNRDQPGVFAYSIGGAPTMTSNVTDVGFVAAKMHPAGNHLFFIQETTSGSNITAFDYIYGTKDLNVMIGATHSEFSIHDDTYLAYATNAGEINVIKIKDIAGTLMTDPPTSSPSSAPSGVPSSVPSSAPSSTPSSVPSSSPSKAPTPVTQVSTNAPTAAPTNAPTNSPTNPPTNAPTAAPQATPTPTDAPTSGAFYSTISMFGMSCLVAISMSFW